MRHVLTVLAIYCTFSRIWHVLGGALVNRMQAHRVRQSYAPNSWVWGAIGSSVLKIREFLFLSSPGIGVM